MGPLEDDDDDGTARTDLKRRVLDPDDQALLGKKLGDYRVDSVLGEGGMGIVFKGEQLLIKKTVAIKVLKRTLASNSSFASRLLDEARAVNAIHHPAIIDAFNFGQAPDGRPYIVMEFLQGEALDTRLAVRGRLSVVETLKLLQSLFPPLEAAHAAGVIHRDLKPSNVFLQRLPDGTDFPKLLDFGLARYVDSQGRGSGIVGTPAYMSPEQAREGDITPAADVYAVGCITYELLSGRPPFEAGSLWGLIEQHLTATPPPLSTLVMDIDDEIAGFVRELMAKDAAKRPTATQARREVARLLRAREEASTVTDGRVTIPEPPRPASSRSGKEKVLPMKNSQEAKTVLGIEGVDAPLPPPKARRSKPALPVESSQEKPTQDFEEFVAPAALTRRPAWLWPVLAVVGLALGAALVLLLRG